tara:strand:- start:1509 stop:1853 length:345 start_codon:yes stop_codon:yes gene_type:complete
MRDSIQELESKIKEIKEQQTVVTDKMLELCNEEDVNSMNTPEGTIIRSVRSTYWTSDWEKMHEYIKDHDALFLLEKRISNKAMKEFLADHPDDLPAGLQANNKYVISVRKPTSN